MSANQVCVLCGNDVRSELMELKCKDTNSSVFVCRGACTGKEGKHFEVKIVDRNTVQIYGDTHKEAHDNGLIFCHTFIGQQKTFETVPTSDKRYKTIVTFNEVM